MIKLILTCWFNNSSIMLKREKLKYSVIYMKYMIGIFFKNYRLDYIILIEWRVLMEKIWKCFMIFLWNQNEMPKIRMTDCILFGKILRRWLMNTGKARKIIQTRIGNWFCIDWQVQIKRNTILHHSISIWNKRWGNIRVHD